MLLELQIKSNKLKNQLSKLTGTPPCMARCHFQPSSNGRLGLLPFLRPIATVKVEGGADSPGTTSEAGAGDGSPFFIGTPNHGFSHGRNLIT